MNDSEEYAYLVKQGEREWGATEPDEDVVLSKWLSPAELLTGDGVPRQSLLMDPTRAASIGSLAPPTATDAVNYAMQFVGRHSRPNRFTRDYADRHGKEFLTAPWCDMFITYAARHLPLPRLTPQGDRAYTPLHASDFKDLGKWAVGTPESIRTRASIGDVVFFDWGGSDSVSAIDHVGLVVKNLGDGRLITVEGNTGANEVRTRVRGADVIAGVGLVPYVLPHPSKPGVVWPYGSRLMRKGWLNSAGVRKVQSRVNARGYRPPLIEDGDFGAKTEAGVRWYQAKEGLVSDGVVRPKTWAHMFG